MCRLTLLLTTRLHLTGRHLRHHLTLDFVVYDLLDVGVVGEVLILLEDVHIQELWLWIIDWEGQHIRLTKEKHIYENTQGK